MFCGNCGRELRPGTQFCPYCRNKLPLADTRGQEPPGDHGTAEGSDALVRSATRRADAARAAPRKRRLFTRERLVWVLPAAALVIAAIVVGVVLLWIRDDTGATSAAQATTTTLGTSTTASAPSTTSPPTSLSTASTTPQTTAPPTPTSPSTTVPVPPPRPPGWDHYSNSQYGFSFDYPGSWKLAEEGADTIGYQYDAAATAASPAPDTLGYPSVGVTFKVGGRDDATAAMNAITGLGDEAEVLDGPRQLTVGGYPAAQITYSCTLGADDNGHVFRDMAVAADNGMYFISAGASVEDWAQKQDIFDTFFSSFGVGSSGASATVTSQSIEAAVWRPWPSGVDNRFVLREPPRVHWRLSCLSAASSAETSSRFNISSSSAAMSVGASDGGCNWLRS